MKITYLFGAGASRNSLPIVSEIPDRVKGIITLLKSDNFALSDTELYDDLEILYNKKQIQYTLIDDLEWLLKNSENHASIDTFAKKLYIRSQYEELDRLRASFSVYLILEQLSKKADNRYDSFFASVLNKNYADFPKNLRILSWNYDFQFEKSFAEFTDQKDLYHNQKLLNCITKYSYNESRNDRFCLLKLNGTTNLLQDSGFRTFNFFNELDNEITLSTLNTIIRNFAVLRYKKHNVFLGLSFAWERGGRVENDIILRSKNETADTEILIVIGYSFPYFNREIDREIINNMIDLKKVYFQAPDADILKERFLSIRNDLKQEQLLSRTDVGQFLLPNEL